MDINNILSKIENYKAQTAQRTEQERVAAEHHRQNMFDWIRAMKPNIDNLIKVAKAAQEAGIPLKVKEPLTDATYENGDFFADAQTHKIGFVPLMYMCNSPYGIGFEGGGCCGNYDFFTDGLVICDKNRSTKHDKEATTEHLEKFIEKFPEFEKAFYDYITKKTECELPIKIEYYIEVCDYEGEKVLESRWFDSAEEAEDWWKNLGYFRSGDYFARLLKTSYSNGNPDDYDVEFVKYLQ